METQKHDQHQTMSKSTREGSSNPTSRMTPPWPWSSYLHHPGDNITSEDTAPTQDLPIRGDFSSHSRDTFTSDTEITDLTMSTD